MEPKDARPGDLYRVAGRAHRIRRRPSFDGWRSFTRQSGRDKLKAAGLREAEPAEHKGLHGPAAPTLKP